MEEQTKEIKMDVEKNVNQETPSEKQPTYEELYKAYMDLAQRHQRAIQQLQQADKYIQTFNRLDYLFKVVEVSSKNNNWHFEEEFIATCIKEIQDIMTLPEEAKETPKEN